MAVLETHIFKAHNNIYIEQPEENYRTREIRTEMVFPDCVNENTGREYPKVCVNLQTDVR